MYMLSESVPNLEREGEKAAVSSHPPVTFLISMSWKATVGAIARAHRLQGREQNSYRYLDASPGKQIVVFVVYSSDYLHNRF